MLSNKKTQFLLQALLLIACIYLLSKMPFFYGPILTVLETVMIPFIIALFFYYAIRPLVEWIMRKFTLSKSKAVLSALLIVLLVILSFSILAGGSIAIQFTNTFTESNFDYSAIIQNLNKRFGEYIPFDRIQSFVFSSLSDFSRTLSQQALRLFQNFTNLGSTLLLIFVFIIYLLLDDRKFSRIFALILHRYIPHTKKKTIHSTLTTIDYRLTTYISSQIIVAAILGVMMYIGYVIIGLPNALLLSFITMISAIIPFLGAFIALVPALLVALTVDIWMVIKVIVVVTVIQQIDGNLVSPKVMGSKLSLHPLLVIVVVFISLSLFGIIGAFIGLPTFLIIQTLWEVYEEKYHEEEATKEDSKNPNKKADEDLD